MITEDITDTWAARVDEVSATWFDALTGSPADLPVDRWPFTAEEKREVLNDATLRDAVADMLQARAELRWCAVPAAEEIEAWLTGPPDAEMENVLRRVALAREKARRHAWLCAGSGLVTKEAAEEKLAIIGALPPLRLAWLNVRSLLRGATPVHEREGRVHAGAVFASIFADLAPVTRTKSASALTEPDDLDHLADCLGGDGRLACTGPAQHLTLRLDKESLTVTAGPSATENHPAFVMELRTAGQLIFSLPSQDGRVVFTRDDLLRAADSSVDEVIIVPTSTAIVT